MLATALSIILCASTPAQAACATSLPDTVGLVPAGSYPFSHGTALQLDSARGLAFVGAGAGVLIVDISDPRNPEVLSDDIRCTDKVKDLWLDGTRLYAASYELMMGQRLGREVDIWDVGDPAGPVLLGSISLRSPAIAVWAKDSLLLVSKRTCVYAWNVADPSNPVLLDSIYYFLGGDMIRVRDTLAFIGSWFDGICVLNIADPTDLRHLATWGPHGGYTGFSVDGDVMYITISEEPTGWSSGLWTYDITDPLNGRLLGTFDTLGTSVYRSAVRDTFAILTYVRDHAVKLVSVADPANPRELDSLRTGYPSTGIAWLGSTAYLVCADRFVMLDMTDPGNPTELGSVPICHTGGGLALADGLIYAGGYQFAVLEDTGNGDPQLLGLLELGSRVLGLDAVDSLGLVVSSDYPTGLRLDAVGLSDPENPVLLGSAALSGSSAAVAVSDSFGFVAGETGLSVRNLVRPGLLVVDSVSMLMEPDDITLTDGLCITSGDRLRIFDVSDPTGIALVGSVGRSTQEIAVNDTVLFALSGDQILMFSISDPTTPRLLSWFDSHSAYDIGLFDTLLAVRTQVRIDIWSVANPRAPYRLGGRGGSWDAFELELRDGSLYTSHVRRYRLTTMPHAIAEEPVDRRGVESQPCPSMVRGVLMLRGNSPATLLDISGRRVADLRPGENDIRHIAPGVYFVRSAESGSRSAVTKVVIQR